MSFLRILFSAVLLVFFFASSAETAFSRNQHKYTTTYNHHHMHSCREKMYPRSLCIRFQSINNKHLPPPPPPDFHHDDEIDPRYGVEKRLVPSGPNPLHN
ncbi:CLAVATA3/ESR (CLE)-related protein 9 [Tripterygium wilfordii]|uniref:CLAVATA3/ESR (CLE)-related protein 9 n=1 Tax=Tripterygium wilfordii TaxID=458696 RepID=UPI0018F80AFD|nr:CLAVATA3/ESR (CLE)-related protein 9 [Tripterygium wilfordii]